jgi:hypothetical protein
MTKAKATTEHASNGQIGQPAACMIENKRVLLKKSLIDYRRVHDSQFLWITLWVTWFGSYSNPHECVA